MVTMEYIVAYHTSTVTLHPIVLSHTVGNRRLIGDWITLATP
jgi:hypothetical protein